jgi:hypothetical protein
MKKHKTSIYISVPYEEETYPTDFKLKLVKSDSKGFPYYAICALQWQQFSLPQNFNQAISGQVKCKHMHAWCTNAEEMFCPVSLLDSKIQSTPVLFCCLVRSTKATRIFLQDSYMQQITMTILTQETPQQMNI